MAPHALHLVIYGSGATMTTMVWPFKFFLDVLKVTMCGLGIIICSAPTHELSISVLLKNVPIRYKIGTISKKLIGFFGCIPTGDYIACFAQCRHSKNLQY